MKFTESPVNGRPGLRTDNIPAHGHVMPIHLNGVLMSTTQFQPYRSSTPGHVSSSITMPTITHRTSSLEMLNNVNDFEAELQQRFFDDLVVASSNFLKRVLSWSIETKCLMFANISDIGLLPRRWCECRHSLAHPPVLRCVRKNTRQLDRQWDLTKILRLTRLDQCQDHVLLPSNISWT